MKYISKKIIHSCFLLSFLALAACTMPPLPKLQSVLDEQEKAAHVVILLKQNEVVVNDATINGGGGLLGVLIESAIE